MSTTTELTDREVIEACAELCGLDGVWIPTHAGRNGYYLHSLEEQNLTFNPLTDANDAWRVLEAVRKDTALYKAFSREMDRPTHNVFCCHFSAWMFEGRFSDIPKAAAKAYLTRRGDTDS